MRRWIQIEYHQGTILDMFTHTSTHTNNARLEIEVAFAWQAFSDQIVAFDIN